VAGVSGQPRNGAGAPSWRSSPGAGSTAPCGSSRTASAVLRDRRRGDPGAMTSGGAGRAAHLKRKKPPPSAGRRTGRRRAARPSRAAARGMIVSDNTKPKIVDLSKRYGSAHALEATSLTVADHFFAARSFAARSHVCRRRIPPFIAVSKIYGRGAFSKVGHEGHLGRRISASVRRRARRAAVRDAHDYMKEEALDDRRNDERRRDVGDGPGLAPCRRCRCWPPVWFWHTLRRRGACRSTAGPFPLAAIAGSLAAIGPRSRAAWREIADACDKLANIAEQSETAATG
jgi:hypothetical protein